ncbi:MAG: hypothetical protein AAF570_22740, partial [Bacteroidota bacterium]
FEWVITNGGCPPSRDTVDIFVDEPPSASNAGPNQTICATTATLAANTPTTGTGTWMLVSGSGTITTPGSPTSGLTALGLGTNEFEWVISNGVCPVTRDTVAIVVSGAPTPPNAGRTWSFATYRIRC